MQLTTLFSVTAIGLGFVACVQTPDQSAVITLPYGRWKAVYDNTTDVYTFRNIRFAAPPIGNLRFAKPDPPQAVEGIQDGSYGPQCFQGRALPGLASSANEVLPSANTTNFTLPTAQAEDCLFLDLYVPGKVIRKQTTAKMPVIVYLYGGAFVLGSKDQAVPFGIYDGKAIIREAQHEAIVVIPNYRLGVFGFLAGTTVEKEGTPNIGLYDQRAAFKWVQDYIHLVDGDNNNVSAWGESAGSGSILHHLIFEGGKLDPLFHRVIAMSPGFEPRFDGSGSAEDEYQEFTSAVGCKDKGLACLRSLNATYLASVNNELNDIIWAPVPDGRLIPGPPALQFSSGNYWKALDSIVVTHTANEGAIFVPNPLPDDFLTTVISAVFPPNSSDIVAQIIDAYHPAPPQVTKEQFTSTVVADLLIKCNARYLVEAYASKAHLAQYSVGNATHGSDIAAVFYEPQLYPSPIPLYPAYDSYFASHAITGDPNTLRNKTSTIAWPLISNPNSEQPGNALNVTDEGFALINDTKISKQLCDVWRNAFATGKGRAAKACVVKKPNGLQ